MSSQITIRDLQAVCKRINRAVNGPDSPTEPWTRDDAGFRANIGVFCIDGAYGGWELHRIMNDGGGITDIFRCGHVPKRELFNLMQAYLTGLDHCEQAS